MLRFLDGKLHFWSKSSFQSREISFSVCKSHFWSENVIFGRNMSFPVGEVYFQAKNVVWWGRFIIKFLLKFLGTIKILYNFLSMKILLLNFAILLLNFATPWGQPVFCRYDGRLENVVSGWKMSNPVEKAPFLVEKCHFGRKTNKLF